MERPAYLAENDAYYADFWTTTRLYTSRFPNGEEAERASVILTYLSHRAEAKRWDLRPPRLLDVGCGRGWLTNLLALYGPAEGCEPSAGAVATARSLFPYLTFHALTPGELRTTPGFQPFDAVVTSEVIEHVPFDLQLAFLRDVRVCLAPGGALVLTTPRGELWASEGHTSQQSVENWLTEAALERLLREAGFAPRQLRRASPVGGGLLRRACARWARRSGVHRPSVAEATVDARSGLYQVWLAEAT
ncbi:MAG: class I SAM-dependent methyltransferase [Vicinamibacterales bacterium]